MRCCQHCCHAILNEFIECQIGIVFPDMGSLENHCVGFQQIKPEEKLYLYDLTTVPKTELGEEMESP